MILCGAPRVASARPGSGEKTPSPDPRRRAVRSHASSAAVAPPGPERAVGSCRGSSPDSSPSTDMFGIDRFFGSVGAAENHDSKFRFGRVSSQSAVKSGHTLTSSSSSSSDSASSTGRGQASVDISNIPSVSSSSRASDPISARRPIHTALAPTDSTPRGASSTNRGARTNKRSKFRDSSRVGNGFSEGARANETKRNALSPRREWSLC